MKDISIKTTMLLSTHLLKKEALSKVILRLSSLIRCNSIHQWTPHPCWCPRTTKTSLKMLHSE